MTVETILNRRLKSLVGRPAYKTESMVARALTARLGEREVKTLRTRDMEEYRRARVDEDGVAHSTVNREIRSLRAAINWAAESGVLDPHQVPPVKWRTEREIPKSRVLVPDEVEEVIRRLPTDWHKDIVRILLGTGARVREILDLTADKVSVVDDRVLMTVEQPKEGEPKVLVAVGVAARAAMRLASRGGVRPFARTRKSTPNGDYFSIYRALKRASELLPGGVVTPHDLRRTFASTALRAGVPLEQIGQVLGHKSLETTRRYARIDSGVRAKVADVVAKSLAME